MIDNPLTIKEFPDGIAFKVRVQPRSSKNAVAGILGDCLKINLTSPPVDGEANTACIAFIANLVGVIKSAVTITGGHKNRTKIIKLAGISKEKFFTALAPYI